MRRSGGVWTWPKPSGTFRNHQKPSKFCLILYSRILQPLKTRFMEYNRIVAVTGLPGLYEIVSSKNDGALVRSVEDQTTKFISSRIHNLSHLESIEIYTTGENVNLTDVFQAMKASGDKLPDAKDAKALKGYFE